MFCTMTRCLDVLEDYLQWRGFEYERLDGSTAAADRGAIVDRFNQPGEHGSYASRNIISAASKILMHDVGL